MADISNLNNYLKDVADAIREKKGTEDQIPAANFDTEIRSLDVGGGIDTSDATAYPSDIISPKTAYVRGQKIIGNIIENTENLGVMIKDTNIIDFGNNDIYALNSDNYFIYKNTDGYLCLGQLQEDGSAINIMTSDVTFELCTMTEIITFENQNYIFLIRYDYNSGSTSFAVDKITLGQNEATFDKSISTINVGSFPGATTGCSGLAIKLMQDNSYVLVFTFNKSGDERAFWPKVFSVDFSLDEIIYNEKYAPSGYLYGSYLSGEVVVNIDIYRTSVKTLLVTFSPKQTDNAHDYTNGLVLSNAFDVLHAFGSSSTNKSVYVLGNLDKFLEFTLSPTGVTLKEYDVLSDYSLIQTLPLDINKGEASFEHLFVYKSNDFYVLRISDTFKNYKFVYIDAKTYATISETELLSNYSTMGIRLPVSTNSSVIVYKKTSTLLTSSSYRIDGTRRLSLNDGDYTYYNTYDSTTISSEILQDKIVYSSKGKIVGTMLNNGELNYNSSLEEQTIPAGYTSGGTIAPAPLTDTEYDECLELSEQILGTEPPTKGHIYGIKRLRSATDTTWERTDDNIGKIANATKDGTEVQNDFDNLSPWKDIISFNYDSNSQSITAYYGDDNFTFTPSDEKVNVFTKIPQFWYKRYIDEDDYEHIQIADYAAEGFLESKEFAVARYSYQGSTSSPRSCSGLKPLVSASGQNYQTGAKSLGNNVCLFDWRAVGAIQLLYLVEYANNNSQETLGQGVSSTRSKVTAGGLDSLGMKSGCLNNDGIHSVMYRGIEDIFGNVYQLIDGVNINNRQAYVCTDPTKYEFEKYDGDYVQVGYANSSSDGYISKLGYDENYPLLMLPIECSGANKNTGFTDYYYQDTGERAYWFRCFF